MSLFRRPTDISSDSSSDESDLEDDDEEQIEQSRGSTNGSTGTEEAVGVELTTTETLSTGDFSVTDNEDGTGILNADRHRNLMLAALLEEFYKTKAAELINDAQPGANYTRNSPEIQEFARSLYSQASRTLAGTGLLPADTISSEQRNLRKTYMTGLDNINLSQVIDNEMISSSNGRRLSAEAAAGSMALVRRGSRQPVPFTNTLAGQFNQLAYETSNISLVPHPNADMRLFSAQSSRISHYRSTFEERGLLGRGGFGRVYHTYNVFDKCEYAVKKIPLSPRLSQRYRQGGHQELSNILREVQALARLDHCNVVRYFATWVEEPTYNDIPPRPVHTSPSAPRLSLRRQKLLEQLPASPPSPTSSKFKSNLLIDKDEENNDPFDRDGVDDAAHPGPEWSMHLESHEPSSSAAPESDIWSDGHAQPRASREQHIEDPSVHVLHVQMSMYPMTLSQYLAPIGSPRAKSNTSPENPSFRHCFHLVPALRILLSILCGLQYIHAKGLVHRDIKPTNIFISALDYASPFAFAEGFVDVGSCASCPETAARFVNPRIGDFGLVAELERAAAADADVHSSQSRSESGSTKAVGTEYYRPPSWANEQAVSKKGKSQNSHILDEKLDVFALGVVLVELLWRCGTRMERIDLLDKCQKGTVPESLKEKLTREGHNSETGLQVEACIRGMIEPDPKRRWDCQRIKDTVEQILNRCVPDTRNHQGAAQQQIWADGLGRGDRYEETVD